MSIFARLLELNRIKSGLAKWSQQATIELQYTRPRKQLLRQASHAKWICHKLLYIWWIGGHISIEPVIDDLSLCFIQETYASTIVARKRFDCRVREYYSHSNIEVEGQRLVQFSGFFSFFSCSSSHRSSDGQPCASQWTTCDPLGYAPQNRHVLGSKDFCARLCSHVLVLYFPPYSVSWNAE